MKIERINDYEDSRFAPEVLRQHGAFLLEDEYPCAFQIVDMRSAVVDFPEGLQIAEVIEEFRFYAGHITRFYDKKGNLLKEYPEAELFDLALEKIQPSQFYVDEDKLAAIEGFVEGPEDVIIPVVRGNAAALAGNAGAAYISLDGHTRLRCALQKGFQTVKAYFSEDEGGYVGDFVQEALKRGIYGIKDVRILSHEEYAEKWHAFCDDYFRKKAGHREDILPVSSSLRLRRYDGVHDFALSWYQDEETVYLVDGVREAYTKEKLERMYQYLDKHGELYFIEQKQGEEFVPIGDVTFSREDMPIVIGESSSRGIGIGRQVIGRLIERGRELNFDRLYVREIYDYNTASKKVFESMGFRACEKTEKGNRYCLELGK